MREKERRLGSLQRSISHVRTRESRPPNKRTSEQASGTGEMTTTDRATLERLRVIDIKRAGFGRAELGDNGRP